MINLVIETIFSICLFINAALFIPQIIRLYLTKDAQGLSLLTFGGFNIIQLFTILHGMLINDYLLVLGFSLSLITCGLVTIMIFIYRKTIPS